MVNVEIVGTGPGPIQLKTDSHNNKNPSAEKNTSSHCIPMHVLVFCWGRAGMHLLQVYPSLTFQAFAITADDIFVPVERLFAIPFECS